MDRSSATGHSQSMPNGESSAAADVVRHTEILTERDVKTEACDDVAINSYVNHNHDNQDNHDNLNNNNANNANNNNIKTESINSDNVNNDIANSDIVNDDIVNNNVNNDNVNNDNVNNNNVNNNNVNNENVNNNIINNDNVNNTNHDRTPRTVGDVTTDCSLVLSVDAPPADWSARDAFRELVRNWRDGIIASSGMPENEFQVVRYKEPPCSGPTKYMFLAKRMKSNKYLGFISYKEIIGNDGGALGGIVSVVNTQATLQPWHLAASATDATDTTDATDATDATSATTRDKNNKDRLKAALSVLLRSRPGLVAECFSGGIYWRFDLNNRGSLVVHLHRIQPGDESWVPRESMGKVVEHFAVGGWNGSRDSYGNTRDQLVAANEFEDWMNAAVFLRGNIGTEGMIKTHAGDLFTSSILSGTLYHKDLLLAESTPQWSASRTHLPLRYGYNFVTGQTEHDHTPLTVATEEAKHILAIWDAVLTVRPSMVAALDDMLHQQCYTPDKMPFADIAGFARYATEEMATRLWAHLRAKSATVGVAAGADHHGSLWYYPVSARRDNPQLEYILGKHGRRGAMLSDTYWDVLRRHCRVLTTADLERRAFLSAERVPMTLSTAAPQATGAGPDHDPLPSPSSPALPSFFFQAALIRLLRACFAGCPQTAALDFVFVRASHNEDQRLVYVPEDKLFYIHARWLRLDGAAAELGHCTYFTTVSGVGQVCKPTVTASETYVLHAAVKALFTAALDQLPPTLFFFGLHHGQQEGRDSPADRGRRLAVQRAEERLSNYFRIEMLGVGPEVLPGPSSSLCLRWSPDLRLDAGTEIGIQCHRASCIIKGQTASDLWHAALIARDIQPDHLPCLQHGSVSCRAATKPSLLGQHLETDLVPGESYIFVLVMKPTDSGAIASVSAVQTAPYPVPVVPSAVVGTALATAQKTASIPAPAPVLDLANKACKPNDGGGEERGNKDGNNDNDDNTVKNLARSRQTAYKPKGFAFEVCRVMPMENTTELDRRCKMAFNGEVSEYVLLRPAEGQTLLARRLVTEEGKQQVGEEETNKRKRAS